MSLLGIFGAVFGAPSAIRNTVSLVEQLMQHGVMQTLITQNPVVKGEIVSIETTFSQIESDVSKVKQDGFFHSTFFTDSEKIAADASSGLMRLLSVYRDPDIEQEILADPALQALIAQAYKVAKADLSLLSEIGVDIPIPQVVETVVNSVSANVKPATAAPTFDGVHAFQVFPAKAEDSTGDFTGSVDASPPSDDGSQNSGGDVLDEDNAS